MSYVIPSEFAKKMVDSGEAKLHMSRRDVLIRSCMAGAIFGSVCGLCSHSRAANRLALTGLCAVPSGFYHALFNGF